MTPSSQQEEGVCEKIILSPNRKDGRTGEILEPHLLNISETLAKIIGLGFSEKNAYA